MFRLCPEMAGKISQRRFRDIAAPNKNSALINLAPSKLDP